MTPIKQHIEQHHGGNQAAFARAVGVLPQQVTKWVNKSFVVTEGGWVVNPKTSKRDANHIQSAPPDI